MIYAGVPSSSGLALGGRTCSNFRASTVQSSLWCVGMVPQFPVRPSAFWFCVLRLHSWDRRPYGKVEIWSAGPREIKIGKPKNTVGM